MRGVSWEGRCLSGRQPPRKQMRGARAILTFAARPLIRFPWLAPRPRCSGPPSYFPLITLLFYYVIFSACERAKFYYEINYFIYE